jgi:hypothetical protein
MRSGPLAGPGQSQQSRYYVAQMAMASAGRLGPRGPSLARWQGAIFGLGVATRVLPSRSRTRELGSWPWLRPGWLFSVFTVVCPLSSDSILKAGYVTRIQTPKSPMPGHRGGFSRSRPNRDSRFPESRDPDQIGIQIREIPDFFAAARTVIKKTCQRQARRVRFLIGV